MNTIDIDDAQAACLRLNAKISSWMAANAANGVNKLKDDQSIISWMRGRNIQTLTTLAQFFSQDTTCGAKTMEEAIIQGLNQMTQDKWIDRFLEQQPFWKKERDKEKLRMQDQILHQEMLMEMQMMLTMSMSGDAKHMKRIKEMEQKMIRGYQKQVEQNLSSPTTDLNAEQRLELILDAAIKECLTRAQHNMDLVHYAFFEPIVLDEQVVHVIDEDHKIHESHESMETDEPTSDVELSGDPMQAVKARRQTNEDASNTDAQPSPPSTTRTISP